MDQKNRKIQPEHPDEATKFCPNCTSPLVIRDDIWVCFTCNFEVKVETNL